MARRNRPLNNVCFQHNLHLTIVPIQYSYYSIYILQIIYCNHSDRDKNMNIGTKESAENEISKSVESASSAAMTKLFAKYLIERLKKYITILKPTLK